MFALIRLLCQVYLWLLIIRVVGSWIPQIQGTPFMKFVAFYTDPYLNIFRRWIPPLGGVLDVSPIAAFFTLQLAEQVLRTLFR